MTVQLVLPQTKAMLTDEQVSQLVQWIADGLSSTQLQEKAKEAGFPLTPSEVRAYRKTYREQVEALLSEYWEEAIRAGAAAKINRVYDLNDMVSQLKARVEDILHEENLSPPMLRAVTDAMRTANKLMQTIRDEVGDLDITGYVLGQKSDPIASLLADIYQVRKDGKADRDSAGDRPLAAKAKSGT